MLTPDE
jgi:bifunctional non-homologous end joining protein LigD